MQEPRVADSELAVLKQLWELGPSEARALAAVLYPGGSAADLATVQTLLKRLENKGFVVRDRSRKAHLFSAAVTREEFAGRQLANMADKLTEGSLTPFLTHFAAAKGLSRKDLDSLRELLDAWEKPSKKKGKRS